MRTDAPDYEIKSTVKTADEIEMSIDMSSLGELFDTFSGLYSDQELAVLRELSTNALDSHIEAGVTRPIEITLPTVFAPTLTIRDFGVGLDKQGIIDVYSKYGASTKRHSDDYNGSMGLGSKSPLTYTPSFTFIGIKNGIKTTVGVSKSGNIPTMRIISESPTTEPNGVTVVIPAKAANQFAAKAEHLFRFWDPDTVLIDGKSPTPITGLKVTDDILVTDQTDDTNYVVMAGVPYPVHIGHTLKRKHALVVKVPTGNVSIVPSREALKQTAKTREAIAAILAEYEREVPNAVQANIEQAESARLAFQALANWRTALGTRALDKRNFKYRGRQIPVEFAPKGEKITVSAVDSDKLSAHSKLAAVQIETVVEALCVYGYDLTFTPSHKKKLQKYVSDNDIKGVRHFILCDTKLPLYWLDKSRVVSWETIRAIKLPRTGGQQSDPNRIAGSYDVCEQGDWEFGVPAEDIDTSNPIYYINTTAYSDEHVNRAVEILNKYKRAYTLVKLTGNRVNKFERTFVTMPVTKEIKRIYSRLEKKVPSIEIEAKVAQTYDWRLRRVLGRMDLSKIDDPRFAKLAMLLNYDLRDSMLNKLEPFRKFGLTPKLEGDESVTKLTADYPLFDIHDWYYSNATPQVTEHTYLYINAVYAASQAKENDSAV